MYKCILCGTVDSNGYIKQKRVAYVEKETTIIPLNRYGENAIVVHIRV